MLIGEEILHESSVDSIHSGVVNGESIRQEILQVIVLALLRLAAKNFCACTSFLHKGTQRVLLQTRITDCLKDHLALQSRTFAVFAVSLRE